TSNEGQGEWLATPRAWTNLIVGAVVGAVGSTLLILFDASKHVTLFEAIFGDDSWPSWLDFLRSSRSIQNEINWPSWMESIALGDVLRTDLLGLPAIDLNVNIPALLVEQIIPVTMMVGLPLLLSAAAWKAGIAQTRRD